MKCLVTKYLFETENYTSTQCPDYDYLQYLRPYLDCRNLKLKKDLGTVKIGPCEWVSLNLIQLAGSSKNVNISSKIILTRLKWPVKDD